MTNINDINKVPEIQIQYLDYNGLNTFLQQLKDYISGRIAKINGSNLNLYSSGDTNPTITSKIEDLQEVIGDSEAIDGSLVENIVTNAEICAAALTDLNRRLKNVEAGVTSSYNAGVLTIITSHNTETEEPDSESTTN